mmetsp:Transcript_117594/g.293196  ORF Transcript_117594/g.293196 Transcript_117594/m.293196 type:complete len:90 (+) Transcript_117594:36-305(+)
MSACSEKGLKANSKDVGRAVGPQINMCAPRVSPALKEPRIEKEPSSPACETPSCQAFEPTAGESAFCCLPPMCPRRIRPRPQPPLRFSP